MQGIVEIDEVASNRPSELMTIFKDISEKTQGHSSAIPPTVVMEGWSNGERETAGKQLEVGVCGYPEPERGVGQK